VKRVLPPTFFLIELIAIPVLHYIAPIQQFWRYPLTLLGLIPLAVGILLNIMANQLFTRHQTTVKPYQESTELVASFPFSVTRNPMYLGITLVLLGVALLFGSVVSLIPPAVFAVLMDRRFVRMEERMLSSRFGQDWDAYRARVRRWL
jgi:protein-S-isoprenylcysteine O-methyltransferase Ste14